MKPPIYQKYVERFIGVVNYYRTIRGPIDKISTIFCQNPTFASMWQKKIESKEGKQIQNDGRRSPLGFTSQRQIANIILFYLCPCDAEILHLLAAVCLIGQYSRKGAYVLRAAIFPDFPPRVY